MIGMRYQNGENKSKIFQDYENRIERAGFDKIIRGVTWKNVVT